MEKIVASGDRDCTVVLDGTECSVKFDSCYRAYSVQNNSISDVFVSIKQGANAGDDGVMRIKAGCSVVFAHMRLDVDTVYFNGTGEIQVHGQNDTNNSFRNAPVSGGGGTTVDSYSKTESDARYAQKTDIPSSLPANGGTADNISGIIILNAVNIGTAATDKGTKRVCNANTVPKTDGFVYAGIWFKNTLDTAVTVSVTVRATAKSPVMQAGYGTGTLRDMFGSGSGRDWFSNITLDTTDITTDMTVPAGKTGYFGFNNTSADVYAVIDDITVFTDKFI